MLEKKFYHTMFSHSFNIPVRVEYWDHTEETYGTGEPTITIKMKSDPSAFAAKECFACIR